MSTSGSVNGEVMAVTRDSGLLHLPAPKLDELRDLLGKATAAPWDCGHTGVWSNDPDIPDDADDEYSFGSSIVIDGGLDDGTIRNAADQDLIVAARNDLPWVLDALDRACELLVAAKGPLPFVNEDVQHRWWQNRQQLLEALGVWDVLTDDDTRSDARSGGSDA